MRNWSSWIPNFNSWINAILLAALLIIATTIVATIAAFGYKLLFWLTCILNFLLQFLSPILTFILNFLAALYNLVPDFIKLIISWIFGFITLMIPYGIALLSPLILIAPIAIIAFAHHYLNLLLERYYPDIRLPEMETATGLFPNVISWWEGLYGLLVIILAMLISDTVLSIIPFIQFNNIPFDQQISAMGTFASGRIMVWIYIAFIVFVQPIYVPVARLLIWIIAAAYLYQFEFTVRQHLIAVGSRLATSDRDR